MSHPFIINLNYHFETNGEKPGEVYLNLVMDYVPDTLNTITSRHRKLK